MLADARLKRILWEPWFRGRALGRRWSRFYIFGFVTCIAVRRDGAELLTSFSCVESRIEIVEATAAQSFFGEQNQRQNLSRGGLDFTRWNPSQNAVPTVRMWLRANG